MARRLLVPVALLFLVLLVLGSLTPTDDTRRDTSEELVPPPQMRPTRTVAATLPGSARAEVGDLVTLTVTASEPGGVEVPAFGQSEPAAPDAPAVFDLLPTAPGRYVVQDSLTRARIGTLVVDR